MTKYVIVDLKTNAEFEKKYHMPIGYGYYEELIFDDFDKSCRMYDVLMSEVPEDMELDLVIEMHQNGEKSIVYDYNMYSDEFYMWKGEE